MNQRYVLLPAENAFTLGSNVAGRLLAARLTARGGGSLAGFASMASSVPGGLANPYEVAAAINDIPAIDIASADASGPPLLSVQVLKQLPDRDGPMLIEASEEDRLALQSAYPGARLVPEGVVRMAMMTRYLQELVEMTAATTRTARQLRVVVRDSNKQPVARAEVQCILDWKTTPPIGATSTTDAKGVATFLVPARFGRIDIEVNPRHSFWPSGLAAHTLTAAKSSVTLTVPSISNTNDCANALYGSIHRADGVGVVVAVVDGGAGPHRLLMVDGGRNLLAGADPNDLRDNGIGHGTHVAGLIAGRSTARMRGGYAPAATLRIYRAYPQNETRTGSFIIAEAIRQAVDDGADLLNLSLSLDTDQPEIVRELKRALALGVGVIAAAGNTGAKVLFPARFSGVIAVSAMGVFACGPLGSNIDNACRKRPTGTDSAHRMATFTCSGPEIDLIGPGVGVVSFFPGHKRAVLSGTSMAAPVVTARLARALATHPAILTAPRDQARSNQISQIAFHSAQTLGFPTKFQGHGRPA